MSTAALPVQSEDAHRWELIQRHPPKPARAVLLWLPALGVSARHYLPLADALAAHGIAVFVHEWRGNGSSSLRPSRQHDWGYRQLLLHDLPASLAQVRARLPHAPLLLGGHSLGGQLACCFAATLALPPAQLWLVASGTPFWRSFPRPARYALPLVYRFLPWLAQRQGVLHGRRLRFAGTEARGLIADWARVGLSNRYAAAGSGLDLEAALAALQTRITGIVLERDGFGPPGSMRALLDKLKSASTQLVRLGSAELGTRADHFAWMKQPDAIARQLAATLP
jgi:predicted alpha/beta hydrolase